MEDSQAQENAPPEKLIKAGRLLAVGEVAPAVVLLQELLEENPDQIDGLNWLGAIRGIEGKLDEAMSLLDRAAAIAPYHAGVQTNRGNVLMDMEDFRGAITAYRDAVRYDEKAFGAMNNLAMLMNASKFPEDAERMLGIVLERLPEYGLAHFNMCTVLGGMGRFDEALVHAKLAHENMPKGTVSIQILANAYMRNNDRAGAIAVVKRWIAANPDDPEASHILATVEGERFPDRATDSYVEALFDRFAKSFDAKLARLEYRAPQLIGGVLEKLAGPANGSLRILDAGCGTGLCAQYAREFAAHLGGADLSAGMLQRAQRTGLYDQLIKGELTAYLQSDKQPYDIVFSADTLCYFGALEPVAAGAAHSLVPGGLFTFTVEASASEELPYRLDLSGRYQHARGYVVKVLEDAGFEIVYLEQDTLRLEMGERVVGHVTAARRR